MRATKWWWMLALSTACAASQAQVFKWVDAAGVTHYAAQAPAGQRVAALELRYQRDPSPAPAAKPALSGPDCSDVAGSWRVSHISVKLDEDTVADGGPAWNFGSDGKASFVCGEKNQQYGFQCADGVLTIQTPGSGKFRIVRRTGDTMVWHNQNDGGYVYLQR